MLVAVFTTFAASRKEPLAEMVERIHAAFLAAGFGEPRVRFTFSDPPGSLELGVVQAIAGIKRVSSIERVLKRTPELERFTREVPTTENLCIAIHNLLAEHFVHADLERVRVEETRNNFFEYAGEGKHGTPSGRS